MAVVAEVSDVIAEVPSTRNTRQESFFPRQQSTGRTGYATVKAELTLEESRAKTEAQVHRLQLSKRLVYGQAGFDLLRQRVLLGNQPAPVCRHCA